MDRIDAMKVFVAAVDEGSLVGAGRRLGRSAGAISRAIACLEAHVGTELLHRTTRSIKISDTGKLYALTCRRVLTDLEEVETIVASKRSAPSGILTLTATLHCGEMVLRPILDAFMDAYPTVSVRIVLSNRPLNLIDEGIDVALRIGHLADSTFVAIPVGEVRRVAVAAPHYLDRHPRIAEPGNLAKHCIVAMTHFGLDTWSFPPLPGSSVPRTVHFTPRLTTDSARIAVASAIRGGGVTRLFSYHIAKHVSAGRLKIVLAGDEPSPVPVHLIMPNGRLSLPKVRAFVDCAKPLLREWFSGLAKSMNES
jgi:DNA-binding transcriptional LysR family regulator